jgi:hypothetical protein
LSALASERSDDSDYDDDDEEDGEKKIHLSNTTRITDTSEENIIKIDCDKAVSKRITSRVNMEKRRFGAKDGMFVDFIEENANEMQNSYRSSMKKSSR